MATGVMEQAVSFVVEQYKKNKDLSMSELRKLGKAAKINVYPVIVGKAKTLLGMGKGKPGRKPKTAAATGVKRGPGRPPKSANGVMRRGPGRPPKAMARAGHGAEGAIATLGDVAAMVKRLQAEVSAAHGKLEKIAALAAG